MAGLAALMTRKKRDRRRELEQMKEKLADPVALSEVWTYLLACILSGNKYVTVRIN